ncbi:MAG: 3'-5' exonuclease [Eubacteriales bacterium]
MDKSSEMKYLQYIVNEVQDKILLLQRSIIKTKQIILDLKKDIWSNIGESDSTEIQMKRQESNQAVNFLDKDTSRLNVLNRLILNPYFAKVNYSYVDTKLFSYIGLSSLMNKELELLICDWRSPVASLFYDSELGDTSYLTPEGTRKVTLTAKRQFKISNSKLIYMLDTSMQVSDDILTEELSKNTSDKMRNIVNTIQREQNSIIRNETDNILIIQGVAGSGKTSIALHRISFLLYRNRSSLTSKDVLIISPSRIFSDYISKVLPELGEQNILETSFSDLIECEITGINTNFGSHDIDYEHMEDNTVSFDINQMKDFIEHKGNRIFTAKDFIFDEYCIDAEYIENLYYTKYRHMGFLSRIEYIYDIIVYKTEGDLNIKLKGKEKKNVKSFVKSMYLTTSIKDIYAEYKTWNGKTPNEKKDYRSYMLKAEDIYELVLLKSLINKTKKFMNIKHLIIDEMQDYSPVQYNIIKELFDCPMTILGDIFQNTNENGGIKSLDTFREIFDNKFKIVKLNKSYRSTLEIMQLARHVLNNDIDIIQRHGAKPVVSIMDSFEDMCERILSDVQITRSIDGSNCAILCKTSEQAEAVYNNLKEKIEVYKITEKSNEFKNGVAVAAIACAKGLEFDSVFIPFADSDNYNMELDRNILYVACTRALHKLNIYSSSGNISNFLTDYNNQGNFHYLVINLYK